MGKADDASLAAGNDFGPGELAGLRLGFEAPDGASLRLRSHREGMKDITQHPMGFASAFEAAFARLQVAAEEAYLSQADWADRVVAVIRAAFEFAASDPSAADVLTSQPLGHGGEGAERYERLVDYWAGLLSPGREHCPGGIELPETIERALAGGILALIAQRVDRGCAEELPELVPDAIQFVLTPYLGTDQARRIAVCGG